MAIHNNMGESVQITYEAIGKLLAVMALLKIMQVILSALLTEFIISIVFGMVIKHLFPSNIKINKENDEHIARNLFWCKQFNLIFSSIKVEDVKKSVDCFTLPTVVQEPLNMWKGKFDNLEDAFNNICKGEKKIEIQNIYIVYDIETTGLSCAHNRIIELSAIAVTSSGDILGTAFEHRIGTTIKIEEGAYEVHGITNAELENIPEFNVVGEKFNTWMASFLSDLDVGILVAHNGNSCDFPFLFMEYKRNGMLLPKQIKYTLDTLAVIRKFEVIPYSPKCKTKLSIDEWTDRTPSGNLSLKLSSIVNVLLKEPERIKLKGYCVNLGRGEKTFDTVCGKAHSAVADAIGAAIVLFDKKGIQIIVNEFGFLISTFFYFNCSTNSVFKCSSQNITGTCNGNGRQFNNSIMCTR